MKSRFSIFGRGKLVFAAAAFLVCLALVSAYFSGLRITARTPGNFQVCSDTVDFAPDYTPPPRTAEWQAEFDKYCPSVFWGEWILTKPNSKVGYDALAHVKFWRPYWGFTWPDNNLGPYGPQPKPTN
jgi:hypothetical protein